MRDTSFGVPELCFFVLHMHAGIILSPSPHCDTHGACAVKSIRCGFRSKNVSIRMRVGGFRILFCGLHAACFPNVVRRADEQKRKEYVKTSSTQ